MLVQVPDEFLRAVVGFDLPAAGRVRRRHRPSCPPDDAGRVPRARSRTIAAQEGMTVLGWRDVPTVPDLVGPDRPRGDAA